eukprot:TRINITY_DN8231_c0_g1_i5.p1 TRINITY_DN8231_c0_g1~~TRINITY_DN8231_c0_g1_i5.p1  ORF type:complete len:145 (-),score=52.07 TRINITY_DN8231_c0_g1_i5:94-528(-)
MVVKDTHKDRIEDNNGNNSGESDSDHKNDIENINGTDSRHSFESRNGREIRNGTDRGNDAITERLESSIEQEEENSEHEAEAVDLVRLKDLIPSITAKDNVTHLDIILEAIRYIDSLQDKLADKIESGEIVPVQVGVKRKREDN